MILETVTALICVGVGFTVGVILECFLFLSREQRLHREIGKLKAQLTMKAILTPVITEFIHDVIEPLFPKAIIPTYGCILCDFKHYNALELKKHMREIHNIEIKREHGSQKTKKTRK